MDLFHDVAEVGVREQQLAPGAVRLRGFRMSVGMTNCGSLGWLTDRSGYRYDSVDPESGKKWPPMPDSFLKLAQDAAASTGFGGFLPDGCLIKAG